MPNLVPFDLVESRDARGRLRVALIGEMDIAVADRVSLRLQQLISSGARVRLDLSRLDFIDISGIRALVRAAQHGGTTGGTPLEFGREINRGVRTTIDLLGVAHIFWRAEPPGD